MDVQFRHWIRGIPGKIDNKFFNRKIILFVIE